jgi:hypothetical protein
MQVQRHLPQQQLVLLLLGCRVFQCSQHKQRRQR